eukprot:NODE_9757_length_462_cov_10.949153_g8664_i0.p3 GENE.NODE_9757_length_462_cov_10.949153_g8664_i0~~NODE_9757_length_462_cov_10.949153_g8664_i0.p3  ORF type:complete len:54 (-),score=1.84 NODE_9757_length_462_cov_10.949153_g8664_i0:198-359(-)
MGPATKGRAVGHLLRSLLDSSSRPAGAVQQACWSCPAGTGDSPPRALQALDRS